MEIWTDDMKTGLMTTPLTSILLSTIKFAAHDALLQNSVFCTLNELFIHLCDYVEQAMLDQKQLVGVEGCSDTELCQ